MNNGKFFAGLALGALVGSALSCFAHSNSCLLYTSPSPRD